MPSFFVTDEPRHHRIQQSSEVWQMSRIKKALGPGYEGLMALLPPSTAARIELLRPSLRASWGGPLNGQDRRRALVRAIARSVDVDVVIETGTYRGTSTEFFAAVFGVPVETVEANRRFYEYSRRRLAHEPSISVSLGDSREFLRRMAERQSDRTPFIYLDAHWEADLPLHEELEIIGAGWRQGVVMIDDFAVPADPGYGFDDYGPGKSLTLDYLPTMPGWSLCYPTASSADETGKKRGCGILLSSSLADADIAGLRLAARL
jgi:predicted O-methyltransferase YrrM